jgi:transcription initiation factor IIF auxiliary subunit
MITISEIVKDGILEIKLPDNTAINKKYKIIDDAGTQLAAGKITGNTQRSCLYIGQLKEGKYQFVLNDLEPISFTIL